MSGLAMMWYEITERVWATVMDLYGEEDVSSVIRVGVKES